MKIFCSIRRVGCGHGNEYTGTSVSM